MNNDNEHEQPETGTTEELAAEIRNMEFSAGSLYVNVDVNDLLETHTEEEVFDLLGKLKDLLQ
jgi:hypothetical protein